RLPRPEYALSGQDQLFVARSEGQTEECRRRGLRQLQTGAGNLDAPLHYPLFQRRDFATALHQHCQLQPEARRFDVRSGGDVRPREAAEEEVGVLVETLLKYHETGQVLRWILPTIYNSLKKLTSPMAV